ncbi:unnamed protein product [Closterium sp. NIES-53]
MIPAASGAAEEGAHGGGAGAQRVCLQLCRLETAAPGGDAVEPQGSVRGVLVARKLHHGVPRQAPAEGGWDGMDGGEQRQQKVGW